MNPRGQGSDRRGPADLAGRAESAAGRDRASQERPRLRYNYTIDYVLRLCYDSLILAHRGASPETILKAERGVASQAAARNRAPGGSGHRPTDPEATPETKARPRAQNRQGGAPRGPSRFARDGRVSQTWCRALRARLNKDTASRRSARPSVGGRPLRRGSKRTRAQKRAAGTKKTALFDIVNRGVGERFAAPPIASTRRSRYIGTDVAIARTMSHARGSAECRRRDQAVGRAAEEASLTSTRRARAWRSSTSRRKTPPSGTTSSARKG